LPFCSPLCSPAPVEDDDEEVEEEEYEEEEEEDDEEVVGSSGTYGARNGMPVLHSDADGNRGSGGLGLAGGIYGRSTA
jgi:hypothetical protein